MPPSVLRNLSSDETCIFVGRGPADEGVIVDVLDVASAPFLTVRVGGDGKEGVVFFSAVRAHARLVVVGVLAPHAADSV